MVFSSSPHIAIRIKFSVPEGRTSRRPWILSSFWLYSNKVSLAFLLSLRLVFISGEAVRLTMTWGDFCMALASSCKDFLVSVTTLVITRAVSMPSPVDSFGRMIWPDCSPPKEMEFWSMAALTLASPTAVISVLILWSLAQLIKPWFAMTVVAMAGSL